MEDPNDPIDRQEATVEVNIAGLLVGIILFTFTIWSLFVGESMFAYLCATLLTVLAVSNNFVKNKYQ